MRLFFGKNGEKKKIKIFLEKRVNMFDIIRNFIYNNKAFYSKAVINGGVA